jgi:hypothetical protein
MSRPFEPPTGLVFGGVDAEQPTIANEIVASTGRVPHCSERGLRGCSALVVPSAASVGDALRPGFGRAPKPGCERNAASGFGKAESDSLDDSSIPRKVILAPFIGPTFRTGALSGTTRPLWQCSDQHERNFVLPQVASHVVGHWFDNSRAHSRNNNT